MEERAGAGDQLRQLSVLIATSAVDMIGFAMVLPLMPFYALKLNATPTVIGLIISSFSVAQLISAPLWGRFSDRYGRRPALLIGLGAAAVAYAVFGLANSIALLFASRVIQGAGGGTTGVAQAYVADSVRPEDRARALGWLSAATAGGIMIGPVIGSFAANLGRSAPGLVASFLCLVNVGFAWKWLPESRKPGPAETGGRRPVWSAAFSMLRRPGEEVPRMVWIYSAGMLAFSMLTGVMAIYLDAHFGFTEKTIGYVFLYVGLLSLGMRSLALGPIVNRLGELWAVRLGTIVLALGFLLYPAAAKLWTLALIVALVPVGTALLFPSTTSLMSRASDKTQVGVIMGIAQTYGGLARMAAPAIATAAYQHLGDTTPFYIAATIMTAVSILAFRTSPRI